MTTSAGLIPLCFAMLMTKSTSSPSKEPRRKGAGTRYVVIWTTVICATIAATFFLANDAQNLRTLFPTWSITQEQATKSPVHDAKRDSTGPHLQSRGMLHPIALDPVTPLSQTVSAEAKCARLQLPQQETPRFFESDTSFQCTALHITDETQPQASVFLQVHSDPAGNVTFFRLKFNLGLTDGRELLEIGFLNLQKFAPFAAGADQSFPRLEQKARDWKPFTYIAGPYRIIFTPEFSNGKRFNLTGTLQPQKAIAPQIWATARDAHGDRSTQSRPGMKTGRNGAHAKSPRMKVPEGL